MQARLSIAPAGCRHRRTGRKAIVERVLQEGTCQNIAEVPERLKDVFVVSLDVSAEEHVRMQAALQAFVDNSLSRPLIPTRYRTG